MGIRKRGNVFEVNVTYKGHRKFCYADTPEQAKERLIELKAELAREARGTVETSSPVQSTPQATSWPLKDAIKTCFTAHWNGSKSEWWYKLKCQVVEAYFGSEKPLHEITTSAVDDFRTHLKAKGYSQSTINHHLAALSKVFVIAHKRGGVGHKPAMGVSKKGTRARVRYLTEKEEAAMIALLEQQDKTDIRDWFCVLIDTGLRPEETQHLTGRWCDFKEGMIHVQPEGKWTPKTAAGIRGVPMTKRVKVILENRCLTYKAGKLFPYPWDRFTNQWDALRKALGFEGDRDFVPYATRHTFGTRLVQRGVGIDVIKDLMGHEDIKTTMQYAKRGAAMYVQAIMKLEKAQ